MSYTRDYDSFLIPRKVWYTLDMKKFRITMSNDFGQTVTELISPSREELDRVLEINYYSYTIESIEEN